MNRHKELQPVILGVNTDPHNRATIVDVLWPDEGPYGFCKTILIPRSLDVKTAKEIPIVDQDKGGNSKIRRVSIKNIINGGGTKEERSAWKRAGIRVFNRDEVQRGRVRFGIEPLTPIY